MIVVDASALSAFILKEPGWERLAPYLIDSISVDHVVKEVVNTIWKACKVRKYISVDDALRFYEVLNLLIDKNILLEPENEYMKTSLEIALNYNITVYDALYIALAVEKNLPILTLDKKQSRVAKDLGIRVFSGF